MIAVPLPAQAPGRHSAGSEQARVAIRRAPHEQGLVNGLVTDVQYRSSAESIRNRRAISCGYHHSFSHSLTRTANRAPDNSNGFGRRACAQAR
jgi:hypothetical protein